MTATGTGEHARPRRFPALDPEPPPRPWWRRLLVPAAVLVAAAVAIAVVTSWPSASNRPRSASHLRLSAAAARGHILVWAKDGGLGLAEPDGGHYVQLKVPGLLPSGRVPIMAPDGRYLSSLNQVITISAGRPAAASTTPIDPDMSIFSSLGVFADHDEALITLTAFPGYVGTSSPITAYALGTGAKTSLGTGDNVAADPAARGAFVSVAAPLKATAAAPTTSWLYADSRVELRDAGHRPVVLATANELNGVLGQDPAVPVALLPCPDPSGAKVAVVVDQVSGGMTGGVVVLNRTGRVLGSILTPFGPALEKPPVAWSPTGLSLAFVGRGTSGPELAIWTVGGQERTDAFPDPGSSYWWCLWSPDESAILCWAHRPGSLASRQWVIANAAGGRMSTVAAPGFPIAWLSSAGRR